MQQRYAILLYELVASNAIAGYELIDSFCLLDQRARAFYDALCMIKNMCERTFMDASGLEPKAYEDACAACCCSRSGKMCA